MGTRCQGACDTQGGTFRLSEQEKTALLLSFRLPDTVLFDAKERVNKMMLSFHSEQQQGKQT